jgi:putative nucleotidyltransferase with HDIG domain
MAADRPDEISSAAIAPGELRASPAEVERVLAQLDALPTLPAVAVRLLELTGDARADARDLSRVIESDIALAARLLALGRRAEHGVASTSIHELVVLLGFEAVRSLALSVKVFEVFSQDAACPSRVFDPSSFWKHSLAVGCAARLLAERSRGEEEATGGRVNPDLAFLCGLLHDIGKIALASCFPKAYDRAMERAAECLLDLSEVERSMFGLDHTLAGRRLAERWKLPEVIVQVAWLHHHDLAALPRIESPEYLRLVQWADGIVSLLRIGDAGRQEVRSDWHEEIRTLAAPGLEQDRFRDEIIEAVRARAELVGLDRLTSREVYQEALSRTTAELLRTNAQLAEANRALEARAGGFEALRVLKQALCDEPGHEDLCRAALAALTRLVGAEPIVLAVTSAVRETVWIAAQDDAGGSAVKSWSAARARLIEHVAVPGQWMPARMLSRVWADRVASTMGRPPETCRAIGSGGGACGVICLAESLLRERETVDVLCDWIEAWLIGIESRLASERLSEELSQINRRLIDTRAEAARVRSLAMVGRMAAGAAHEINNPLAVISGRAQLLASAASDEKTRQAGETIADHAARASDIVSELMAFAKPAEPKPTLWSAAEVLSTLRREWIDRAVLTEKEFELHISDEPPQIHADEAQIRMLLDELVRNAVDAMQGVSPRRLVVNCWRDVTDEKVMIRIEDNGYGMSAEVLEQAADPFFSHRVAGRGRGLGLSRATRYAEVNGGSIRLFSTPGQGTKALVELPSAGATPPG